MALLFIGEIKMKKNIKNSIVVIVITAILLLGTLMSLGAAKTPSAIQVNGVSATQLQQNDSMAIPKPQTDLNEYENAVAALINNYRADNGINPVAFDGTLTYVAKLRSQDLMDRNYFSHYTPEGSTVFNLLRANSVSFSRGGENLAQAKPANIGTPDAFLNAWANSPTHKSNMLNSSYNYIGVGMVSNGDRIVVTTVFTN
jgi:uncharacterized protein YkwD